MIKNKTFILVLIIIASIVVLWIILELLTFMITKGIASIALIVFIVTLIIIAIYFIQKPTNDNLELLEDNYLSLHKEIIKLYDQADKAIKLGKYKDASLRQDTANKIYKVMNDLYTEIIKLREEN